MGSQQQMHGLQLQTGEAGALFLLWRKSSNLLYLIVPADSKGTLWPCPCPSKVGRAPIYSTLLTIENSLANCSILHWERLYVLYTKLCRLCQYVRLNSFYKASLYLTVICLSTCYEACHIMMTSFHIYYPHYSVHFSKAKPKYYLSSSPCPAWYHP